MMHPEEKIMRIFAPIRIAAWLVSALLLALSVPASRADDTLTIDTPSGPVAFTIELALTPEEQARGLMFRNSLAERHGMLFDFGAEREPGATTKSRTPLSAHTWMASSISGKMPSLIACRDGN